MILAVDPGLATCGWSVIEPGTGRVLDIGIILSAPDPELDDSTDRARRAFLQAIALIAVAQEWKCKVIVGEAMSFGGPPNARFSMAIALGLSWGVIVGIAASHGIEIREVPPKEWQHSVLGRDGKVPYDEVFAALHSYVEGMDPFVVAKLLAIPKGKRNHPLDSVGVGVHEALHPGGQA